MKPRYTLSLQGTSVAATSFSPTFAVDMHTLIPPQRSHKKFLLYSSFTLAQQNDTAHSGIKVGIDLPPAFYKSIPSSQFMVLGVAIPYTANPADNDLMYNYTEMSSCVPMINYPDTTSITLNISTLGGGNMVANRPFILNLVFEECES